MNYYIHGDAANAKQIKAAFEKLGYDTTGHLFNANSVLYFTLDGEIRATTCNCTPAIIKTHPDYTELELTIEPCFNVGDKIEEKHTKMYVYTVLSVDLQNQRYLIEHNYKHQLLFKYQDNFELVQNPKPHYDVSNFHAGMPVLVRADNGCSWDYSVFSRNTGNEYWPFAVCNGVSFTQCIPFNEDTKHLLGTTDMCDEMYINW